MIINTKDQLFQVTQTGPVSGVYQMKNATCNLLLNPESQIQSERNSFYSSNVTIQNLNLLGSLVFFNCTVTIVNSQIIRTETEKEIILLVQEKQHALRQI
jgi:hypothetical protein